MRLDPTRPFTFPSPCVSVSPAKFTPPRLAVRSHRPTSLTRVHDDRETPGRKDQPAWSAGGCLSISTNSGVEKRHGTGRRSSSNTGRICSAGSRDKRCGQIPRRQEAHITVSVTTTPEQAQLGRLDRSTQRQEPNCYRRVGPPRAGRTSTPARGVDVLGDVFTATPSAADSSC